MTQVRLSGTLKAYAGGREAFEIGGGTIRELLVELGAQCPKLKPLLDQGVAVAIDGQIYQDALLEPIREESEVHVLPQIAGG